VCKEINLTIVDNQQETWRKDKHYSRHWKSVENCLDKLEGWNMLPEKERVNHITRLLQTRKMEVLQ
jgi:hypothetical protein